MGPKIYLFGDSITEESFCNRGWGASLAHQFSLTVDVVLRGYSGYNTRWALKVMDRVFPAEMDEGSGHVPVAMTVLFDANDTCLPDRCAAFQDVPVDEYKHNVRLHSILSCLKFLKRWPATNVILITPPPIDEDGRLLHPCVENLLGLPKRTNEAASAYAQACVAVAKECGISVVDLWTKMQQFPDWRKAYLRDGLHLTQCRKRIVFEEVIKKLMETGLSLETLPIDLPLIETIDPNDPLNSFKN